VFGLWFSRPVMTCLFVCSYVILLFVDNDEIVYLLPMFSCFALLYMMVVLHCLFVRIIRYFLLLWIMMKHIFVFAFQCLLKN